MGIDHAGPVAEAGFGFADALRVLTLHRGQQCRILGGALGIGLNLGQGLTQGGSLMLADQLGQLGRILLVGTLLAEPQEGTTQQQAGNGQAQGGQQMTG